MNLFGARERSRSPPQTRDGASWDLAKQARQPNRASLQQEAKELALGRVAQALGQGYRFEERGSLFSPYLTDISDVDIQMFSSYGTKVGAPAAEALLSLASSLLLKPISVRLVSGSFRTTREVPWEAFQQERNRAGEHEAVVVCGIYRNRDGWLLPMDVAASVGVDRETLNDRIAKIAEKAAQGNFAKVLQKIRGMVRQPLKSQIASAVNNDIGPLRFLTTQLSLLRDHPSLVNVGSYLDTQLGLRENTNVAGCCAAAERDMQQRARQELMHFKHSVAGTLPPGEAAAFRSALRSI